MTVGDVLKAIKEQNIQVAAGRIGQSPVPEGANVPFQLTINTQGRMESADEFGNIIVKTGVKRPECLSRRRRSRRQASARRSRRRKRASSWRQELRRQQLPGRQAGGNAGRLPVAGLQRPEDGRGRQGQDAGSEREVSRRASTTDIYYDTTVFVDESIHEVYKTLIEAFILVFIVVLVFLQDWRATIVPMIAVPVSLVGTLAMMSMFGFSLNNLSLFGLVLAIGIVVDDAIVVVENVERYLAMGHRAGSGPAGNGRGFRAGGGHRAGALRGLRSDRVHGRHQRRILPPVRLDDRRLDGHFDVQFAHAQPGAVRHPLQGPRRGTRGAGHGTRHTATRRKKPCRGSAWC